MSESGPGLPVSDFSLHGERRRVSGLGLDAKKTTWMTHLGSPAANLVVARNTRVRTHIVN